MKHDILLDGQVVGHCIVTEEGLYYRFQCQCRFCDKHIYKIFGSTDQQIIPLGICVPQGSEFFLEKRIPIRKIGQGSLRYYAQRADLPVISSDSLDLSRLQDSYLSRIEEGVVLSFKDRSEDQRDNDQSP